MRERERSHSFTEPRAIAGAPSGPPSIGARGGRLVARAWDAMERSLSQDSDDYLRANEQRGAE